MAKAKSKSKVKPAATANEILLPLRITVLAPPTGVQHCLQSGQSELVQQTLSDGNDISFDFTVRVKNAGNDQPPRFLGSFTQGPPNERFVYICLGTMAGQADSPWTRRAKIPLAGITWPLIRKSVAQRNATLEFRYAGLAGDGGPTCATVRSKTPWQIVK